ncbi:MAG: Gfo/Idh/MocA family oxidoreductase [Anaerolineales bacterium]|nr:Gfo/Idh/MocA family oxidoreductase [Anaerolineales bacterium]
MVKTMDIGLVGLGYIGKIHANAYRNIPVCFSNAPVTANLKGVLRSQLDTEQVLMDSLGFTLRTINPEEFFKNDFDMVDICTPNILHLEEVEMAAAAGLNIYLEKPMAMDLNEARQMTELAQKHGIKTHMALVFRYVPAVRQMKALIEAGAIGEVYNFNARFFHGSYVDPNRPMTWRLRWAESGGGVFADLGSHMIDLIRYLLGEVVAVKADMRTFISRRPKSRGSSEMETVDVDDWLMCLMEMENGAPGLLEVSRMAAGVEDTTRVEVFGTKGALRFSFNQQELVDIFDIRTNRWYHGSLDVPPVEGERPIETLWPNGKYSQGMMTNAHMASGYDFLLNIAENKESKLDFAAGMAVQEVMEAGYQSARSGGGMVRLPLA